jgi:hypothetical protein
VGVEGFSDADRSMPRGCDATAAVLFAFGGDLTTNTMSVHHSKERERGCHVTHVGLADVWLEKVRGALERGDGLCGENAAREEKTKRVSLVKRIGQEDRSMLRHLRKGLVHDGRSGLQRRSKRADPLPAAGYRVFFCVSDLSCCFVLIVCLLQTLDGAIRRDLRMTTAAGFFAASAAEVKGD